MQGKCFKNFSEFVTKPINQKLPNSEFGSVEEVGLTNIYPFIVYKINDLPYKNVQIKQEKRNIDVLKKVNYLEAF